MPSRAALEQAIQLHLMPTAARAMQAAPLPSDVGFLLRVLARDPGAEAFATERFGRPIETIREAAEYYAGEILFSPGATAYRALGAAPDASRDVLRANMGFLLRWLHPDHRNTVEHQAYFERVVHAWELLGSPERRAEYDRRLATAAPARSQALAPAKRAPFFATTSSGPPRRPARRSRRRRVLLALAALFIAGLGWLYVEHEQWLDQIDLDWLTGAASGAAVLVGDADGLAGPSE